MSGTTALLGDIASLQAGIGFPPALQGRNSGDFPFAKVGDISRCGRSDSSVLSSADHYVDQTDVDQLRAKLIPVGSVLFAKIGEAIRQNHRVMSGRPMLIDNNAMAAIPNDRVDGRFLYQYLKTVDFYALAPATTVPALRKSELAVLRIPLPPLEEQRRIAAILDQAETLRTQRRVALAQLDSLTQSIFLDMFGDPVANPRGWVTRTLDEVTLKVTDGEHLNPVFSESGMPIVMAGNVLVDQIDLDAAKRVETSLGQQFRKKCGPELGDLLIVGRGATIGRLCRVSVSDTFCLMGSVILVKPDRSLLDERFLSGMLALPSMHAMLYKSSGSSAQQAIYLKDVKRLVCPLPPLPLQQTFATRIQAIESLKATHREALSRLDALFASLQQRAFAGKL